MPRRKTGPNYLTPGLDVRYTMAMLFFLKHGYERFGETYNLTVDLTGQTFETERAEAALAGRGVTIRRARPDDQVALTALLEIHWPAWKAEVDKSLLPDPPSLHLAFYDDQVIGFSAYDTNNLNSGWFGPMGTDPDYRSLGIGEVLLKRCLGDQKDQGHRSAIIPWVGPISFYAHHAGATIDRVFYRYEKHVG